jgi:hypothetical protein
MLPAKMRHSAKSRESVKPGNRPLTDGQTGWQKWVRFLKRKRLFLFGLSSKMGSFGNFRGHDQGKNVTQI